MEILTCSMARDAGHFALLADSVDRHVDPSIRHTVIVPRADRGHFDRFATPRRVILAQEEILPLHVSRLPALPAALARLAPGLRRPLYLDRRLRPLRGWMLQQLLKLEYARFSDTPSLMHVDSDVIFFRPLGPADGLRDGRVRFFRAEAASPTPEHRHWIAVAAHCLGQPVPSDHRAHYVENCVLWSPDLVRAMLARVEAAHGRPWPEVLARQPSLSEYFLYGLYADSADAGAQLAAEDQSFCLSFWPQSDSTPYDFNAQMARLVPKHCAVAIQSTHDMTLAARADIARRATAFTATPA